MYSGKIIQDPGSKTNIMGSTSWVILIYEKGNNPMAI